jgi:hypothetical protein
VTGLQDLPHAPAAQRPQEDIRADREPVALAAAQEVGLVGGEPLSLLQCLKELLGRRAPASDAVEVPELPGREEIMPSERLNQRLQGAHAAASNE